ncbi:MAG: acetyl-CoA C-acetyltransferase [Legionellales bacterium]|nr:acetyl-CoA C-acetyltransferase [Legionellales bacterium]
MVESKKAHEHRAVYIVDACRTPFLKARTEPGPFSASDLAVATCKTLLLRQPFLPTDIDEVVTGCMMPSPKEANISRIIALRLGCGKQVPAFTVQRNCASGLQSVDNAYQDILMGRHNLVLAGGTEAMSHAPILLNEEMTGWLGRWFAARTFSQKLALLPQIRPKHFKLVIALLQGLSDPLVGLSMGQTAENVAYQFGITREEMDAFAVQSHHRLAAALDDGLMSEIAPIFDATGRVYESDDGLRRDSSIEKLAKLPPFFDKKFGMVTAGNSSQITDGAAYMILASAEAVKRFKLPVIAKIVDIEWAALAPEQMGLGPVHAVTPILKRQKLGLKDIDYWEINEAFAAQVLGCAKAWSDDEYCQSQLGLPKALGELPIDKLNINGGAIALGHPIGASGTRVLLHVIDALKRNNAKRGIASLCIGGGQGGAMLVERVTEVE